MIHRRVKNACCMVNPAVRCKGCKRQWCSDDAWKADAWCGKSVHRTHDLWWTELTFVENTNE